MGLYLQCIVRFRHLSHMLSHYVHKWVKRSNFKYLLCYVQISSSIHALLHAYLVGLDLLSEPPSICIAFLYVRSDKTMDPTMDPRCARAANALMRLCICTGSFEFSIFA